MTQSGKMIFLLLTAGHVLLAQTGITNVDPKPVPDSLVFTNGEKIIGKLVRSAGGSVTFHSESMGDVTVPWEKVKELNAEGTYALIGTGVDQKRAEIENAPRGKVAVTNQQIEIRTAAGELQHVPVSENREIIDEQLYENSLLHRAGLFQKWTGSVAASASLVQATQSSRSYTGNLNLVRAIPAETFLERRNRSAIDVAVSYGNTLQPGFPNVRTEILHADAEHDIYFSPRAYGFGQAAFDHNYSQGLDLQQTYGLGIGWTVVKRPNQELNLKVSAGYEKQQFFAVTENQNLFGSIFSDTYQRKFGKAHAILFAQNLQISPAWSNLNAYSAVGSASLTAPIFRRFSFVIGVTDAFVNNPSPGFRKNSFQANTGLSFTLK